MMRLARFLWQDEVHVGLLKGDGIIDLSMHLANTPRTITELFLQWDALFPSLSRLEREKNPDFPLTGIRLLAPIERPGKILGIGLNYADHAAEARMELPAVQLWFVKVSSSVNDPFGDVQLPIVSDQLDYEAELVVVIGKRCRHVSREEAASVIFGYCVGNDFSVRDWQLNTSQFSVGKSFDTHAPIGPWIVTADAVDVGNLGIRCFVNGEIRQNSNTSHLIFDSLSMIEHLSKAMTLEPGDLLFTGTPAGVGFGMNPKRWLTEGDVVRVEIDGIGALENRIVREGVTLG